MELSRLVRTARAALIFHGDALAGVYDFDGKLAVVVVLLQFLADHLLLAHQNDFDA